MTRTTPKHSGRAPTGPFEAVPVRWGAASGQVVQALDGPRLPATLLEAVSLLVTFEFGAVFVYRGNASPTHVFDSLTDDGMRLGLRNYVSSTYVLNPFYAAYLAGLESGAYRMRELSPDGFFEPPIPPGAKARPASSEEIGYLTEGWPAGREEVCLALRLPDGECAEISLSRTSAHGGFSDDDVARLTAVIPFLQASVQHYWTHFRTRHVASVPDTAAEEVFQSFGEGLLSPREREIAQLLLRGHSTVSVGLRLGISPTTVKTHRKNLYAKLGISTQFELFARFLDALPVRRPG